MSETVNNPRAADFETIRRAFAVFNGFEGPTAEELWWRTDDKYAPVTLFATCNDLFFWACSDCEAITPENIGRLEAAYEDARAVGGEAGSNAHLLWCCRERGMRPQTPYYKHLPAEMHALFDACGPDRSANPTTPAKQVA